VREDYSQSGNAWDCFTHDQARSRAYRWGEDGLAGICDDRQLLCFSLALGNGQDAILKERLFGLTNSEGNHGEDVKEDSMEKSIAGAGHYAFLESMFHKLSVARQSSSAVGNSHASIIFGKGITSANPGSGQNLVLAVDDVDAARNDLIARGVEVSELFHYAGGPFNNAVDNARVSGRDPQGRSYYSFASFQDPDGNGWLLQEIRTRLPGPRMELTRGQTRDVAIPSRENPAPTAKTSRAGRSF
jgi:hypothetical protein